MARPYREVIESLDAKQLETLRRKFGGDWANSTELILQIRNECHDNNLCFDLKELFGIEALTSADQKERLDRQVAAAAVEQAAHARAQAKSADEANTIAQQANEIAVHANETAKDALRVARQNMIWTAVAGVVAALALILSLYGVVRK